jgi:hypothetical protein
MCDIPSVSGSPGNFCEEQAQGARRERGILSPQNTPKHRRKKKGKKKEKKKNTQLKFEATSVF